MHYTLLFDSVQLIRYDLSTFTYKWIHNDMYINMYIT